jgi:SAM-dependent methyltransferase
MSASDNTDAIKRQYATHTWLRERQAIHEQYTIPRVDYARWVLDRSLEWRGDEHVLDLGCGIGEYRVRLLTHWPDIAYYGMDFSAGMLRQHEICNRLVQADALRLPFADGTFDVVMANHVLYHLADIDAALVEIRRVLKPEGVLVAATNSLHTMPEMQVLMRRAIVLLTKANSENIDPPTPASDRFALENGSLRLGRYFYAVMRHDLPAQLVFDQTDPIMRYLESTRTLREPQLPPDVLWDDVMLIMQQQMNHLIHHLGALVVNKMTGVLIATNGGGFVREFLSIRDEEKAS